MKTLSERLLQMMVEIVSLFPSNRTSDGSRLFPGPRGLQLAPAAARTGRTQENKRLDAARTVRRPE